MMALITSRNNPSVSSTRGRLIKIKIGLMMVENRAFIERIAWYTVGIVNVLVDLDYQKTTMADGLGTGTACTWKGHGLILTAEHVIANAQPKDLAFLLRVDEAINRGNSRGDSLPSVEAGQLSRSQN